MLHNASFFLSHVQQEEMFKEWIVNNVASIKLHLWIIHILTFNRPARLVFFVVFFYYYKMLHIKSRRQPGRLWRRREGGCPDVILPPCERGLRILSFSAQTQGSCCIHLSAFIPPSHSSPHALASSSAMKSSERSLSLTPPSHHPTPLGLVPGSSPKPTTPL